MGNAAARVLELFRQHQERGIGMSGNPYLAGTYTVGGTGEIISGDATGSIYQVPVTPTGVIPSVTSPPPSGWAVPHIIHTGDLTIEYDTKLKKIVFTDPKTGKSWWASVDSLLATINLRSDKDDTKIKQSTHHPDPAFEKYLKVREELEG